MKKKLSDLALPSGAACAATITGVGYLSGEATLSEVWWTLRVRFPGAADEKEWKAVFFLNDLKGSDALIRELSTFGIRLEHADDVYDALEDADGKTVALSGPPDAEGRCAHVAIPTRRWRPTAAQRSHRSFNYGFERPHEEYGESRYVPLEAVAEPALQCAAAAGPRLGRAWSFGA